MVRRFARSGNSVEVGVGPAGSGKTAVMAVLRELALRTATPICGAALAGRAAAGLQAATGIRSSTLARFLGEAREGGLPRHSIVVVDEAGMVGTRTLFQICDLMEELQGKLILVGDHRQLAELEAGGLFRALAHRLPAVELTENVRQVQPWERDALAELRHGSVERAVAMYRGQERIRVASTAERTVSRAVEDWYRDVMATGDLEGTLLIAQRNQTVEELNARARDAVASSGRLRGRPVWVGERAYQAGDRALCRKNRPGLGVLNGDLGTVVAVDRKRGLLTVCLDRDGETRTLPASYTTDHLTYGYALTGHKAQGVTVRRAFTVAEGAPDREWAYVAMSRGRETKTLYLTRCDPVEECTHLTHRSPDPARALAPALGRSSAQVVALDGGTRGPQEVDRGDPRPPRSNPDARIDWLVRRKARELARQRLRERSGLEREPPALGIGR